MIIGYARTSTVEQEASFEAQRAQLKAAGCEKVFKEQVSAVSPEREQLDKGRAPTARAKAADVLRLRKEGVGPTEIAKQLRIGRTSVYRALGEQA